MSERTVESLLIELASAIRAERKSSEEIKAEWRQEVDNRLEAVALLAIHGVQPSTYIDERDRQVSESGLGKIFRASGTY